MKSLLYEVDRQYGPIIFFGPMAMTKWLPRVDHLIYM